MHIHHPQVVGGRTLWIDPEIQDLIDRLHHGDPSLGWEGDPALALYRGPNQTWELWRLEDDGEYRIICRSRSGLPLDQRLIVHLIRHDARRGNDAMAVLLRTEQENAALEKRWEDNFVGASVEIMEKVHWGVIKDLGSHNI